MLMYLFPVFAQTTDSVKIVNLNEVTVVSDSYEKRITLNSALSVKIVEKEFLEKHFTGNLVQALEYIPGVKSMDIGSGFSKPMIRGMAFNRIAVVENGIKQEGQQWGSDHGLEIDAFNIERLIIRKGPSSLLYGSDAIGGVVEITQTPPSYENEVFGEAKILYKSVNNSYGGSFMLGVKKNNWYTKLRYSEQHFGDYSIPADTIVYLTQRIPVYNKKLINTAGFERNASLYSAYHKGSYSSNFSATNAYQKTGFFPGAHGIPDISRVKNDGNDRNIGLPFSQVNHLKVTTHQQYSWSNLVGIWDVGYQNNHREEWSQFHTHYGNQTLPEKDPDKELAFSLNTYSSSVKLKNSGSSDWEHNWGWDVQYQQNQIGGYSFLLPEYNRFTTGIFSISSWKVSDELSLSGGLRYDYGKVKISAFEDEYLNAFLQNQGYDDELKEKYRWRSYAVNRSFGDLSGSFGLVWNISKEHLIKANIGHSFRLPGANELAANGVHHGTFRHEQGDSSLNSEKGWQLDASYSFQNENINFSISPFISWFGNYIYLQPTGEWSILPHAGQIYRYTGAEVLFAGGEATFTVDISQNVNYSFTGEYTYTSNKDERTPLSFSPPASMRNTLTWKKDKLQLYGELYSIASQNRVAKNEATTSGTNLINLGGSLTVKLGRGDLYINLSLRNLLNKKYYNHLSFYRKVEIPEPGRNIQLLITIPFKISLK